MLEPGVGLVELRLFLRQVTTAVRALRTVAPGTMTGAVDQDYVNIPRFQHPWPDANPTCRSSRSVN